MQREMYTSAAFVISCGTVTIDLARRKILLIRWRATSEILLPKGRKNIGESLEAAAMRETWEETGHKVHLLPLPAPTLATADGELPHALDQARLHTEPIAVTQRFKDQALKIIFWFGAYADSTICDEGRPTEAHEDFETIWADFDDACASLSFADDQKIVQIAIDEIAGPNFVFPHVA